jgi:hypothetical protein
MMLTCKSQLQAAKKLGNCGPNVVQTRFKRRPNCMRYEQIHHQADHAVCMTFAKAAATASMLRLFSAATQMRPESTP